VAVFGRSRAGRLCFIACMYFLIQSSCLADDSTMLMKLANIIGKVQTQVTSQQLFYSIRKSDNTRTVCSHYFACLVHAGKIGERAQVRRSLREGSMG
jgi:hypothetical protein